MTGPSTFPTSLGSRSRWPDKGPPWLERDQTKVRGFQPQNACLLLKPGYAPSIEGNNKPGNNGFLHHF
jgi:hypothetical protein